MSRRDNSLKKRRLNFVEKSRDIHGNRYMYHNFVYTLSVEKSNVFCPYHGDFLISPTNHMRGKGCPKCALERASRKLIGTVESFIEKAEEVHGDMYDYSKAVYRGSNKPLEIICPKHGPFWQTPGNHTYHKQRCGKCAGVSLTEKERLRSIKESPNNFNKDKTDYSKAFIERGRLKCLVCKIHKTEYEQSVSNHLKYRGCPSCHGKTSLYSTDGVEWFYSTPQMSNLYIFICPEAGVFKVGLSVNIKSRKSAIEYETGYSWYIHAVLPDQANFLWGLEQHIHRNFKTSNYDWYFQGYTECYDMEYLPDVVLEINKYNWK